MTDAPKPSAQTYSLAEIKNGSGWPKGARFALVEPRPEITDAERLNKLTTIRRALDVFRDAEIARLVRLDSPDKAVTMYGVARIAALGNLEDIAVATAWIDAAIRKEKGKS